MQRLLQNIQPSLYLLLLPLKNTERPVTPGAIHVFGSEGSLLTSSGDSFTAWQMASGSSTPSSPVEGRKEMKRAGELCRAAAGGRGTGGTGPGACGLKL